MMTDQSDWVKLAERLGPLSMDLSIPSLAQKILLDSPGENAQDLLIGRALRVAWDSYVKIGGETDPVMWLEVAQGSGDYRARAALELLDAVGYEHD
jgi:hypothetical protein